MNKGVSYFHFLVCTVGLGRTPGSREALLGKGFSRWAVYTSEPSIYTHTTSQHIQGLHTKTKDTDHHYQSIRLPRYPLWAALGSPLWL